jgi:hypothetical protein
MTVECTEVIDIAGTDKVTGEIVLTISDHLPWEDEETHFRLIEKKISRYLDFVRSGQVFDAFPQARQDPIRIDLIYQYPHSNSAARFLSAAQSQLKALGIVFSHNTLPNGY